MTRTESALSSLFESHECRYRFALCLKSVAWVRF